MSSSSGARPAPITTKTITDARKAFVSDVNIFKQKGDTLASQTGTFQAPTADSAKLGIGGKNVKSITGVAIPELDQITALSNLFRERAANISSARATPGARPIFTKDN